MPAVTETPVAVSTQPRSAGKKPKPRQLPPYHVVLLDDGRASQLRYSAMAQERDEFFVLLGEKRSLDWIEHGTLRKKYGDPRVHYAVNCASAGCPMLREEAYVAGRLDAQLEQRARRFLADRTRNRLRGARLEVSRIFDWFGQDFEPREKYFARYAEVLGGDAREREAIRAGSYPLHFLDYDWSLNDASK